MKRCYALGAAMLAVSALPALCQKVEDKPAGPPESAKTLMNAALKTAKAKKKPVFVLFDASW